ncbi:MAG: hypothetical protein M3346_07000, partial [Actinomycetota bacterium]|nr:hypothetical protein [Actinomycetota bacterium]
YIGHWLDVMGGRMQVVFFEQWSKAPAPAVRQLCAWLGLDEVPVTSFDYAARNPAKEYRSRKVASLATRIYRAGRRYIPFDQKVKQVLLRAHTAVNAEQTTDTLDPKIRSRLEEIYRPSNERLAGALTAAGYADLPGWLAASARSAAHLPGGDST